MLVRQEKSANTTPLFLWRPVPPSSEFVALGCIATTSDEPPPPSAIHCVPRRWCRLSEKANSLPPPKLLWRDDGRNASGRTASIWRGDAMLHTMQVLEGVESDKAKAECYSVYSERWHANPDTLSDLVLLLQPGASMPTTSEDPPRDSASNASERDAPKVTAPSLQSGSSLLDMSSASVEDAEPELESKGPPPPSSVELMQSTRRLSEGTAAERTAQDDELLVAGHDTLVTSRAAVKNAPPGSEKIEADALVQEEAMSPASSAVTAMAAPATLAEETKTELAVDGTLKVEGTFVDMPEADAATASVDVKAYEADTPVHVDMPTEVKVVSEADASSGKDIEVQALGVEDAVARGKHAALNDVKCTRSLAISQIQASADSSVAERQTAAVAARPPIAQSDTGTGAGVATSGVSELARRFQQRSESAQAAGEVQSMGVACDHYRADLSAATFGSCKCGRPKDEHRLVERRQGGGIASRVAGLNAQGASGKLHEAASTLGGGPGGPASLRRHGSGQYFSGGI